jgi:hypothetical protein
MAAERVVRGEVVDVPIPDLPSALMSWEPSYPTAIYKKDKVEAPTPPIPDTTGVTLPDQTEVVDDTDSLAALGDLVEPWTDQSNGRSQTTAVDGDHLAAIAALGMTRARVAGIDPGQGLSWMAWAAASGGAHGRRRGAAAGRYLAWWAVAMLTDLDWPADPESMGTAVAGLSWHWFDDGSPETGWLLRLAISSADLGLSWAIAATDQV